ncbi:hypothetical protein CXF68_09205 [Tenacibaculum sp. Bg11-29]|uniref:hypothetical protein n=1 Tax=Tenacibaculum sp. Bg11-29 TaxID=2058306 RepID=UPI000C34C39F|nr:hypothetical protein [Tenacibaculum sp. Bg11-29]PKH50852.1 hypothetical protein CXF68_09205 [Tenacibaculum sp. Bg11-29]
MAVKTIITTDPVTLIVPLKPYLVKFLKKKFGESHKASRRTWVGLELVELLTKDYCKPPSRKYTTYVTFIIPYSICTTYGHFIKYTDFDKFENKCAKLFKDALHDFVKINSQKLSFTNKATITDSLKSFLRYYNITEDDLNLDSLYRGIYRSQLKPSYSSDRKKRKKITTV